MIKKWLLSVLFTVFIIRTLPGFEIQILSPPDYHDTNINLLSVTGSVSGTSPGDTVNLYVNGNLNYCTELVNSVWQGTVFLSSTGDSILSVVSDSTGQKAYDTITVNFENTLPSVSSHSPAVNSITNDSTNLKVKIEYSDTGSGISTVKTSIFLDTGTGYIKQDNAVKTENQCYFLLNVSEAYCTVLAELHDNAGNIKYDTWNFEVDAVAPQITLSFTPDISGISSVELELSSNEILNDTPDIIIKDYSDGYINLNDTATLNNGIYRYLVNIDTGTAAGTASVIAVYGQDIAGNRIISFTGETSFYVITTPPDPPDNLNPADNYETTVNHIFFSWNADETSVFELSLTASFNEIIQTVITTDNNYDTVLPDSVYYWRIFSIDKYGNASIYSEINSLYINWYSAGGMDSCSLIINAGNDYTNTSYVILIMYCSNADSICFQNDTYTGQWSEYEPYNTLKKWDISNSEGEKKVYVKFFNNRTGDSVITFDTIIYDTIPPSGSITNTEVTYDTTTVILKLEYDSDVSHIKISGDITDNFKQTWITADDTVIVTLQENYGEKNIIVYFRDKAGNISENFKINLTYKIEAAPPVIKNLKLTDGNNQTGIDASDNVLNISSDISDSSKIYLVRYFLTVYDSPLTNYNYTFLYPDSAGLNKSFILYKELNPGDTIFYQVYAEDIYNNTSTIENNIIVSNTLIEKPEFNMLPQFSTNYYIQISGYKQKNTIVWVNNIKSSEITSTTWEAGLTLTPGTNPVTIYATLGTLKSDTNYSIIVYDPDGPVVDDGIIDTTINSPDTVIITAADTISGVDTIYVSLNNSSFEVGNKIYIFKEYANLIKYYAVNNAGLTSNIYSKNIYFDITPPQNVTIKDEGEFSSKTELTWSWQLITDSSGIEKYFIEFSTSSNFSDTFYDTYTPYFKTNVTLSEINNITNKQTYYAKVYAVDNAGNRSVSAVGSDGITVDTSIILTGFDTIPVIEYPDNFIETNVNTIIIKGIKDPAASIILVNGAQAVIDDNLHWHKSIILIEDTNIIYVKARDNEGNISGPDSITIFYNNIKPQTPVLDSIKTITNDTKIILSGIKGKGDTIEINGNSNSISTGSDTFYSEFIQTVSSETYYIIALNNIGNRSDTVTVNITIDTVPPEIPIVNYFSFDSSSEQLLYGTKEINSSIYVNDTSFQVLETDTGWRYTISLNEGNNTITIKAIDKAGNYSDTVILIYTDFTPPEAPVILYPANNYRTGFSFIDVSGIKPANSYCIINDTYAEQSFEGTIWSYKYYLGEGENVVSAMTADTYGNLSSPINVIVYFSRNLFLVENKYLENKKYIDLPDSLTLNFSHYVDTTAIDSYIILTENNSVCSFNWDYLYSDSQILLYYDFKNSKKYVLTVKKELTDTQGTHLEQDMKWTFYTLIPSGKFKQIDFNFDAADIRLDIPAAALKTPVFISVDQVLENDVEVLLADIEINNKDAFHSFLGSNRIIFKVTSSDSQDSPVTSFEDNLTLSYEYKDADNDGIADETDIEEKTLKLARLTDRSWDMLENSAVNEDLNIISVSLNKFSIFTVIGETMKNYDVFVYPNPALNKMTNLRIKVDKNVEIEVQLVTLLGRTVMQNKLNCKSGINEFPLNLSGIPAGGYYLLYRIDGKKDVIGIGIEGR